MDVLLDMLKEIADLCVDLFNFFRDWRQRWKR